MTAQRVEIDGEELPFFAGVWAIFGHGNVAGMGEALAGIADEMPTYRGHNEQGMAHAAIAFAKASRRQRAMACTTLDRPGCHEHGDCSGPGRMSTDCRCCSSQVTYLPSDNPILFFNRSRTSPTEQ